MQPIIKQWFNPLLGLNPFDKTGDKEKVPAAIAIFPKDIWQPPKEFMERFFNIQQWTEMSKGGHWAALEQQQLDTNGQILAASKLAWGAISTIEKALLFLGPCVQRASGAG